MKINFSLEYGNKITIKRNRYLRYKCVTTQRNSTYGLFFGVTTHRSRDAHSLLTPHLNCPPSDLTDT